MNYVPNPNDLFYVQFKPYQKAVNERFGDTKVIWQRDNSYDTDVFKCVAVDDTMIVAIKLTGYQFSDKPHVFRRNKIDISPVSPDILKAIGLIEISEPKEE